MEEECPICCEECETVESPCKHKICEDCWVNLGKSVRKAVCPLCRFDIDSWLREKFSVEYVPSVSSEFTGMGGFSGFITGTYGGYTTITGNGIGPMTTVLGGISNVINSSYSGMAIITGTSNNIITVTGTGITANY